MGLCHKVEDSKFGLPRRKTEATTQLLQEDGQAVCGTKEKYRIYFGYIDSFIENVDHTGSVPIRYEDPLPVAYVAVAEYRKSDFAHRIRISEVDWP